MHILKTKSLMWNMQSILPWLIGVPVSLIIICAFSL